MRSSDAPNQTIARAAQITRGAVTKLEGAQPPRMRALLPYPAEGTQ